MTAEEIAETFQFVTQERSRRVVEQRVVRSVPKKTDPFVEAMHLVPQERIQECVVEQMVEMVQTISRMPLSLRERRPRSPQWTVDDFELFVESPVPRAGHST